MSENFWGSFALPLLLHVVFEEPLVSYDDEQSPTFSLNLFNYLGMNQKGVRLCATILGLVFSPRLILKNVKCSNQQSKVKTQVKDHFEF